MCHMTQERITRATSNTFTDVVNHAFCESDLSTEDKRGKKRLEDVHTYAELKHDRRASLPDSFTVCSTIMTSGCLSFGRPSFFTVLDNDRGPFLSAYFIPRGITSKLGIGFRQRNAQMITGKIPPLFPNHWTRSCIAVNTTSGLINWVVEGTLVLSKEFVEVKISNSRPKDLSKRRVLFGMEILGLPQLKR